MQKLQWSFNMNFKQSYLIGETLFFYPETYLEEGFRYPIHGCIWHLTSNYMILRTDSAGTDFMVDINGAHRLFKTKEKAMKYALSKYKRDKSILNKQLKQLDFAIESLDKEIGENND